MLIRYDNTKEDSIAFHDHWIANSPDIKKRIESNRRYYTLFAFVFYFLCAFSVSLLFRTILASIGAVVVYARLGNSLHRNVKKQMVKSVEQNPQKNFLCEHTIEITHEGIVERNAYTENKVSWAGIEKIESTPEHTFIYVAPGSAHVIPNHAIKEGDLRAFLVELGARYDPNKSLAPLTPPAV